MQRLRFLYYLVIIGVLVIVINACGSAEGDNPGYEYMPDMYHSIAYESNLYDYYYYNTWDGEETYYGFAEPRKPVKGTIPRGYAGLQTAPGPDAKASLEFMLKGKNSPNSIAVPVNGNVPYYYDDTEEERTRAMAEIINNPYPITAEGLAEGKELYDIFCGICHGAKGDGLGYLVADENKNSKYPAAPANFLTEEFIAASNGRYYHSIIYGKNVMGGYADKMSFEERWQVIHYIRSLQAKELKLAYSETENTLNAVAVPGASIAPSEMEAPIGYGYGGPSGHGDGHHGDDHGDDGHDEEHHEDGHGDAGHEEEHHEDDGEHKEGEGDHEGDH